jgi:hypothetical protein
MQMLPEIISVGPSLLISRVGSALLSLSLKQPRKLLPGGAGKGPASAVNQYVRWSPIHLLVTFYLLKVSLMYILRCIGRTGYMYTVCPIRQLVRSSALQKATK